MKTIAVFLTIACVSVTALGQTNQIDQLRQEFRTRCANLANESLRPGSSDALLKKVQSIARDVFAGRPEVLHAVNEKWYEGLPVASRQELESFKSEWAMQPTNETGRDTHAMVSQVPLPAEAGRYYMQGVNPLDVVYQILDFARSMTGVPSEVMIIQTYVPPDVNRIANADDSHQLLIRTVWCEVRATLEMTQAGVFVPVAIEGRKTLQNHTSDGIRQPADGSPKPSM
jgi:hypothetical protein